MDIDGTTGPSGHTDEGGVLVGDADARRVVVYEDPQCPFCRQFEDACGELLRAEVAAGRLAVEYRMRCFLGQESARANNALALAAEAGRFDELRSALFADQPPEQTGGFTTDDLVAAGAGVGLAGGDFESGVRDGRYERWVTAAEARFLEQDPDGTPNMVVDGRMIEQSVLYDGQALAEVLRG